MLCGREIKVLSFKTHFTINAAVFHDGNRPKTVLIEALVVHKGKFKTLNSGQFWKTKRKHEKSHLGAEILDICGYAEYENFQSKREKSFSPRFGDGSQPPPPPLAGWAAVLGFAALTLTPFRLAERTLTR